MDQQQDTTSEINQEEQPFTASITEPVVAAELPERLQIFAPSGFFTARWKHCHDDIDHDKATAIDANNRVAYVMMDYIRRDLSDLEVIVTFREDFEIWKTKSFNIISNPVRRALRDFLIARGVKIQVGRGLQIPTALARVVEEDGDAEDRLNQSRFAAIEARYREQMERIRRSAVGSPRHTQKPPPVVALRPPSFPTFPIHTQQARPAPGTDLQPPLAHRHLRQLPPKVTESQIPSTYEKKSLHVLRVPPLQYCPVPTQPQPVPREKLLPPQLPHQTPTPTSRTEIRPTLLHQDPAGNPHVKITAGSDYKLESASVDKDVSSPVNGTFAEFRHSTPGDAVEEHPSVPLKSAAVQPLDEPAQHPDEALDKRAPTDEEETSRNEDSADAEESDGPNDDQTGKVKETLRGEFAPATYMLSPDQGSFWSPPAPKLLTNTVTLVDHLFTDFENYFRLVERLVP
ncbi:hypothetical protein E4U09_000593 [Claviceps aff. purpurea]|uniref:Uncharacterized protein n=1 Tax=Claviceps aff. purpurea TaxID=1967640 RepID=A0A9P7QAU9_9HYPO|nr:hypothetical protein E4U09_000593 [Claviceps aff. purpurea]